MKEIVFGGTPSLSRQGLGSLSTIMLNHAAGFYGDAAIAGMSIVTRLSFFISANVLVVIFFLSVDKYPMIIYFL